MAPLAFSSPISVLSCHVRTCRQTVSYRRPQPTCVVAETAAAAFVEAFKGVIIGPTINEMAAAVAGGTVGVMGTLMALEVGRARARLRKQCPYCSGSGRLPCGQCFTLGSLPSRSNLPTAQETCELCTGVGSVQCMHCEGEGRLLPIEYERALRARYESYDYTAWANDYYEDDPPYM